MPSKKNTRSKQLSWLLRHGAVESGLDMDAAGWASIEGVLACIGGSRDEIEQAVRDNTKRRLQIDGDRIRACQGHSLAGTPVTHSALEASWREVNEPARAYHGTAIGKVESIFKHGLHAAARTHVHLAASLESVVGKRANVDIMIEIDLAQLRGLGQRVYEAPNGVLLVRAVPSAVMVQLHPMTRRARAEIAELRAKYLAGPG